MAIAGLVAVGGMVVGALVVRQAIDDPDEAGPPPLTVVDVEFLGAASIPAGFDVQGTTVGGLSGIGYEPGDDAYFAVSDDPRNPRVYRLEIAVDDGALANDDVTVTGVTRLDDEQGDALPAEALEGDGIAVVPIDPQSPAVQFVVCNEGNAASLIAPSLMAFDRGGTRRAEILAPRGYEPTVDGSTGMQAEGGCSSVTVTPGPDPILISGFERPLGQDLPAAREATPDIARILTHDLSGAIQAEFGYPLGPTTAPASTTMHRLVDLAALDAHGTFLALEISTAEGQPSTLRLYEATLGAVANAPSARTPAPVDKTLVLDFGEAGLPVGEFQGMAIGPQLDDGRQVMVVVSDNNLVPDVATQILAFAVRSEPRPG
jgi:hypothetical protein